MPDADARRRLRRHERAVHLANQAIRHHVHACGPGPWTPEQRAIYQALNEAYVAAVRARDRETRAREDEPEPEPAAA